MDLDKFRKFEKYLEALPEGSINQLFGEAFESTGDKPELTNSYGAEKFCYGCHWAICHNVTALNEYDSRSAKYEFMEGALDMAFSCGISLSELDHILSKIIWGCSSAESFTTETWDADPIDVTRELIRYLEARV